MTSPAEPDPLPPAAEAGWREGRGVVLLYVTCASRAEAEHIGRTVVREGLAACANIDEHRAIYPWQGKIEEATEGRLLLKTTVAALPALKARILALHSYTLPALLAFPVASGLAPYLDWVEANTMPSSRAEG
jgi:periplasmic divalent cation tolerance protein